MCIRDREEIAYENGWIDRETLSACAERYGKSEYGKHLKRVAAGEFVNRNTEY